MKSFLLEVINITEKKTMDIVIVVIYVKKRIKVE